MFPCKKKKEKNKGEKEQKALKKRAVLRKFVEWE
jgi:hypothetical protein